MRVTIVKLGGFKTLRYQYKANKYMSFDFTLLSEVGQPWQREAQQAAQVLVPEGFEVKTVELPRHPWVADAVVKKETQNA